MWGYGPGGGAGTLTLVLGTHCKRTSGAVAVNAVYARKRGAVTDPSTLRREVACKRRATLWGQQFLAGLVQRKHP